VKCALGFDDGPFPPFAKIRPGYQSLLVGTLMRRLEPLWFSVRRITVDGLDSTDAIIDIYRKAPKKPSYMFFSGITFAGFNVFNPDIVYRVCGTPLILIVDRKPSMSKVEHALKKHFKDWRERLRIIASHYPKHMLHVRSAKNPIYFSVVGISVKEAIETIRMFTVHGKLPEPIRLSSILATRLTSITQL